MSRRGTVKKDASGRWMFVVDIAAPGAARKQVRRRGFKTKADANNALVELLGDVKDGTFVPPSNQTVREFVTGEWLPAIRSTIEASTYESYSRTLESYVLPALGNVQLQALEPSALNRLYAELLENGRRQGRGKQASGLSPRSVRYAHTILHRVLRDAAKWGRLTRNVASLADPPSAKSARAPEMHVWTPEELRKFLDSIADERIFPAVRLAAMTGMRRGEVFGLRWAELDLDARRLVVRRQLRVVSHVPELVETPKSSKGQRSIDLDAETVAVLTRHRASQARERLALGAGYRDQGLVFAMPDGSFVDPEDAARVFERRVTKSGLPRVRFHDLRHTHACHLIAAGQHVKVVSERLGHASTAFTMDRYGHVMPNLQSDAASAVSALVDG